MWPGQQPAGDDQNPQQPNPYQQPGYQQPNPYQPTQPAFPQQQPPPGYGQQPPGQEQNPYAQQGQQGPWGPSSVPGGPQMPYKPQPGGDGGGSKKTVIIAAVAAVAVVAAAVGGFLVFRGDDKGSKKDESKGSSSVSAEPSPKEKKEEKQEKETTDPGAGGGGGASKDPSKPQVSGWQTVVNPKWYSAFDVPETKDWTVAKPGVITGFEDDKGKALVAMSAPAYFKDDWCKSATRAAVGTKGAQGSKDTKEASKIAAANFAIAGYDQKQKGTLRESGPKSFSNKNGIKGYTATATVTNAPKEDKCSSDGKVVTASWINSNGDLAIWVLYTDANVKDEIPDATIKKMLSTLRNYEASDGGDEPRG